MAEGNAFDGLERELTCAICTDILYQPLTLLDCLHTFCGSCLQEWFAWQAASAAQNRRNAQPYSCPSCREAVRGTKADWRLTTLLEGFLKGNPDRVKSDAEKEEMRKTYSPGDDVIPKVEVRREETDSEDERLLAEVRELSMTEVDPEARRRARRAARNDAGRTRQQGRDGTYLQYRPEEPGRSQQPSARAAQHAHLSEERVRQHNADELRVEHQPSLRSLLSASPIDSQIVQEEIMRTISAEGALEGIDLDNLTPDQEEELTERIAEAYRRRQRRRDRSRDHRQVSDRSPQPPTAAGAEVGGRHHTRTESASAQQPRSRPPVSRPHLFEQNSQDPASRHRRSPSATSYQSSRTNRVESSAARSATDLTDQLRTEEARRETHRRMSSNARSTTDPENRRPQIHRLRASSASSRDVRTEVASTSHPLEAVRRQAGPTNNSTPSLPTSGAATPYSGQLQSVRPATSTAAFAPEPVSSLQDVPQVPNISCSRCNQPRIQHELHYHCAKCRNGTFNLCVNCYRNGQGCDHWYGFGFKAEQRWHAMAPPGGWPPGAERPHVLAARKYVKRDHTRNPTSSRQEDEIEEGAYCDNCFSFANDCYWYCLDCLEGAWGYCDRCVHQGKHCTHPLLPVAHLSTLRQPFLDPTRATFVPMPHLRPDSYVLWPCSSGDYDICTECYYSLVATGKISQASGPNGWRRCLQGHRMAVVGFQDVPNGGQQRVVVREPVGGMRQKDESQTLEALPPPSASEVHTGQRCIAMYNYFPREAGADDLTFPKNAEITEVKDENAEWLSGVYVGKLGLFPSSHVR